jgi:hypothetical protein
MFKTLTEGDNIRLEEKGGGVSSDENTKNS